MKDNVLVICGGRAIPDVIEAVIDQNKIKKKVQKIIIFTSPKNHAMNVPLINRYPGLVINVTDYFSNLTNGFALAIEEIENAAAAVGPKSILIKGSIENEN